MDDIKNNLLQNIREQMEDVKTQIAQVEELLEDGVFNTVDSSDSS